MIRVSHLTKRFGVVTAVDDLSLTVAKGEALALWGGNGAGKTTALRAILGVLPVEGAITIDGRDVARDGRACRRRIGFVPQELAFHDDLTVDETWTFYARLKRADASASRRWLRRLELDLDTGKRVRELSGGMKRRLALALALVGDPPILLLDEPTANLDAASRDSFLALLGELKAERKTLLFTSHRAQDVLELADRVVALDRGRIVAEGTAREILGGVAGDEVTLRLPAETVAPAFAALARAGFIPRKNGQGLVLAPETAADAPPLAPPSLERPRVAFVREEA